MTTMPANNGQDQSFPRLSILDHSFDDFLSQAELELACRGREVRALRRRARRQRRRQLRLHARVIRFLGKAVPLVLAIAGSIAFAAGGVLLIVDNVDDAKDAFMLSAAAWGAATAIGTRAVRRR
ncbi:hypothetical protein ACFZCG_39325 [Streptomyces tanashiensis]|uniref:hypothetical protein n=1 Tax=Streptomyces tanashiensis TaxID=67367 RepID=UPI0036E73D7B